MGNIKTVKENGSLVINYAYDDLNQLYIINDKTNKIYTHYSYDDAGNIISVLKRGYNSHGVPDSTISEDIYTYGDSNWKDKLTKFNGQTITYDEMGNPLSYRNGLSFEWERGRILSSVTKDNNTIEMKYDSNGMRTQKGNVQYYYDSGKRLIALVKNNNSLLFYYDANGNLTSMQFDGNMYFFIKNLQGDVERLVDENGTLVAKYSYNAWGEIVSIKDGLDNMISNETNLALLNPFRYRSYIYDDETGLYYLQHRYYDPITGRFLNADIYCDTDTGTPLSTNMFAYCENNVTMKVDANGEDAIWLQDSTSVWTMGHTSLLLQESKGRWWYFYWGPNSIQLLFLGTIKSRNEINKNVNRILRIYKKYYGFNLEYANNYNMCLEFKGNF